MRWLRLGMLAVLLSLLLTAAVVGGYSRDQQTIRWFPGTGIAGKLDVWGSQPGRVAIEDRSTATVSYVEVFADGSFVAQLPPATYRLWMPGDSRSVTIRVPAGECVDVVIDFRIPGVVLQIPG